MANIDIDFTDEELLRHTRTAHELDITFNQYVSQAIMMYLIRSQAEEIEELKRRMKEARKLLKQALRHGGAADANV